MSDVVEAKHVHGKPLCFQVVVKEESEIIVVDYEAISSEAATQIVNQLTFLVNRHVQKGL